MLCLLLLTHGKEVLGVHAACIRGHAHTHKAGHGTGCVGSSRLHGIGLRAHQGGACHHGILQNGGALQLLDHLGILGRQSHAAQCDADHLQAAQLAPLHRKRLIHGVFQIGIVGNDLIGPQFQIGKLCKSGLQGADKLGFQLAVQLVTGVVLRNIAANLGVEQQRVGNAVGINARAADGNIHIQTDLGIHHPEGDGIGRAELIVQQFLGVEIIDPLILAGVAAKGEALAHRLEGLQNAFTQRAGEDAGLGGGVVCKLTGLGTDLHDLSLLHDHHALTVCHGDDAAVGNNIIAALGVGRACAHALAALDHHGVLVHCLAVEIFLPLICQSALQSAQTCLNKSHK